MRSTSSSGGTANGDAVQPAAARTPRQTRRRPLGISAAYLSVLERGHRGKPTPGLIQQTYGYFGLIWNDVETLKRLADISHPRVTLDIGLTPSATVLANELAKAIAPCRNRRSRNSARCWRSGGGEKQGL